MAWPSREQEECNELNMLFLLFEVDAYLWYNEGSTKPYFLSWKWKSYGRLYTRNSTTYAEALKHAKKRVLNSTQLKK